MTADRIEPGSETDLAIERALDASALRAGGSLGSEQAQLVDVELSAAESGDASAGLDAD